MATKLACVSALAVALVAAQAAHAQTAPSPVDVFTPEDFQRFSPRTALDLVREIPGFSIEGSDGGRGLGQASGNVLINGQRLSSKSNDTLDALDRVPVGRVARLELVDGAGLGIPGLSGRVVNVIITGGAVSGTWSWQGRLRERIEPSFNEASLSLSGEVGDIAWTLGLENNGNRFGNKGPETITDALGDIREIRDEELLGSEDYYEGSIGLNWTPPNGHEANFNAAFAGFNFERRLQGIQTDFTTPSDPVFRTLRTGEDEWNGEVGADYAFPIFGGRLKLIGLHRHEDSRFRDQLTLRDAGDFAFQSGIILDDDFIENEAIARAEFDWTVSEGRDWQVAAESAYNRLDAGSSLFDQSAGGDLALSNRAIPTLVEENRYEASVTHSRRIGEKLTLQASLAGEFSEISSEVGSDTLSESFIRPKGYLAATYSWSGSTDIALRLEREVGQLSFFDFVASQDIDRGNDDGGNRDLVPEQSWVFTLEIDRDLGRFGAAELTLFHEEIEDQIDRIPLGGGGEGPGNVDTASQSGIDLTATINFDPFGLEGLQFEFSGFNRISDIEDPLTGRGRRLNGRDVSGFEAELRWDIPGTDYAVLIAGENEINGQRFRLDEVEKFVQSEPFAWVEAEHKDLFGTTAFIRIGNIFDSRDVEETIEFAPDRTGAFSGRRLIDREFGYILTVGLSGDF